jgi:hypothetical protein
MSSADREPQESYARGSCLRILTHFPYQNWSAHFIRGKGAAPLHRLQEAHGEAGVLVAATDYAFLVTKDAALQRRKVAEEAGSENGSRLISTIVLCDAHATDIFSHILKTKGLCKWAARSVVEDLHLFGYKKVVIHTDQEPAMV